MEEMKLEIQIISTETIKPSFPTPTHLKTFKLSLIDQIFPAFHIPILLFYTTPITKITQISTLKSSLSETLSEFYPLAGRCIDDSTVSCNDQGIPFIKTYVNSRLTQVFTSSDKLDLFLPQLLPPREYLALGPRPISELVPLAFQFNVFSCGAVVIGCYMLHKLLDASSLGTFCQYWASLASNEVQDGIKPDFNSIVKAFPPSQSIDKVIVPDLCKEPILESDSAPAPVVVKVKSFRLSKHSITQLKSKAASETHPNPTSFETVAGFIWQNVAAAARTARAATHLPVPETTVLLVSINMRSRTNPKLPKQSVGNCITDVQAKTTRNRTLPEVVAEIHSTVTKSKAKVEMFQGEKGVEEICADRKAASQFVMEDNACVYQLSSWCKLGLDKANFGFGKPNLIIPTDGKIPASLRNFIFFTDYYDSNDEGIDVWLFLEEKELQILQTNPNFMNSVLL